MDKKNFNNAIARAQKLMLSEDFNRKVENMASSFSGSNKGGYPQDFSSMEKQVFGGGSKQISETPKAQTILQETTSGPNYNNLPEFMRAEFKKNPPLSGDFQQNQTLNEVQQNLNVNKVINEQQMHTQTVQQGNGQIDYSIIKAIVNECIKENMKNTINESIAGFKIGNGNVLRFVDKKGNVYEGVLKLKKKATK